MTLRKSTLTGGKCYQFREKSGKLVENEPNLSNCIITFPFLRCPLYYRERVETTKGPTLRTILAPSPLAPFSRAIYCCSKKESRENAFALLQVWLMFSRLDLESPKGFFCKKEFYMTNLSGNLAPPPPQHRNHLLTVIPANHDCLRLLGIINLPTLTPVSLRYQPRGDEPASFDTR